MQLLLIRHALPLRVEREDGHPADPPLSARGVAQAERLADWLRHEEIDAVYSSPMRRAVETAEPLARGRGCRIEPEPDVVELDHQSPTYVPLEEIKAADPAAWRALVQGGLYAGIDLTAFRRRVSEAFTRIIGAHPGERVAVICHGGVINAFAGEVLGITDPFLFFDPAYTSVSRFLAAQSGERSLLSLNETGHLRA